MNLSGFFFVLLAGAFCCPTVVCRCCRIKLGGGMADSTRIGIKFLFSLVWSICIYWKQNHKKWKIQNGFVNVCWENNWWCKWTLNFNRNTNKKWMNVGRMIVLYASVVQSHRRPANAKCIHFYLFGNVVRIHLGFVFVFFFLLPILCGPIIYA